MKLRNKKTNIKVLGEIVSCNEGEHRYIVVKTDQGIIWYYRSLAELNAEWEDYEEPKEKRWYWCVDYTTCGVDHLMYDPDDPDQDEFNESIGNYFDTREEAEKAVEKLKAWKRLKDKGLKFFNNKIIGEYGNVSYRLTLPITNTEEKDLDLLFGGEE